MIPQGRILGACAVLALLPAAGCGGGGDSPDAAFAAGLAHMEKGAWHEAVDAYSEALEGKPNWIDAYVNRGVAKAALGDYDGAIEDYDKALRLDPEDTDTLVNRGLSRHELGQYSEALEDYTAAIAADETDKDAYRNRALTFRVAGELVAAVEDYSAAIRLDPDDIGLYRERAAVRREQEDEDAAAADDALVELSEEIAAAPQDAVPRRLRGLAFFEMGEYMLALSDLSDAIRLAPEDPDTYVARAHAWFIQGHSDQAIKDYTQAIEQGVEAVSEAHTGRGNAYESLGDIAKAVADYTEAVRLNPDDEDAPIQLAWIFATHPAEQYRNGERAVELATRAVELTEGRHWRALDVKAAADAEVGNFDEAKKYAGYSLELAPRDMRDAIRKRLTLYGSKQPFRDLEE